MTRKILQGKEAREALLRGAEKLAKVVGSSMGPQGKNTVIDRAPGYPTFPTTTRDGVTIAKEVYLDGFEDTGSRLVREAADRACQEAGDGTTAATVLAYAIYKEGLKALDTRNVVSVKKEIEDHTALVCQEIDKVSKRVSGNMVDQVATISTNNDPVLGKLIADAMRQAGPNGVVAVEENAGTETIIERIEGMQFQNGFITAHFVNRPEKQIVELINPLILLLDRPLTSMQGMSNAQGTGLMDRIASVARPLLVLAEDISGEALALLTVNKLQGRLECCAVKLPSNLGHRKELLQDIAALTGGTAVLQELGMDISKLTPSHLGKAEKVVVTPTFTRITGGFGTKEAIDKRIADIKGILAQTTSNLEKERLQERLAKLTGGVTVLRLGAQTGLELGDKKGRCEDACFSTRCALESGIVPGAGVTLARIAQRIPFGIVSKALTAPALQILENAGMTPECLDEVLKEDNFNIGTNSLTGTLKCDLIQAGVIDPAKVVKSSLKNAASVAIQMLLTENVIQVVKD